MTIYSEATLQKIWANGIPMSRAWYAYAHADLKEKWNAAQNKSAMTAFEKGVEEAKMKDRPLSEVFMSGIVGSREILTEREKVRKSLQTNIINHVKLGRLLSFGFEPPRSLSSVPVAIPPDVWKGHVDWTASSLSGQSLQFIEVRLISPEGQDRLVEEALLSVEMERRQAGRPSIKLDVQKAFSALEKLGGIDVERSAKAHFPLIRQHMRTTNPDRYPESYKLGDEGIRSHFTPLFNELRKSSKQ
ncbi:hypothetical protein [Yoonia sp. TsM2_T14_4]|uniref:hypothetical protein n=1 Tax=Yoonia sp. TsM2_T14_4 TaxID=3415141 RepID=UPI003C715AFC